jgi:hypothetical protein
MYRSAFYFFSPLKSFILLAENAEEKATWMQNIQECIHKALSGKNTSAVRVSLRTDALLQEEEESFSLDPAAFVIKNGWLNILTEDNKKMRRLWISLTMQSLTFSTTFKAITPDENLNIGLCEALPMSDDTYFRVMVLQKATNHKKIYVFETQCHAEREEWLRALIHCISGSSIMNVVEMRRRSLNCTNLAPIFMFNKVSNVCTLCYHSFAVYRPRHHCRYTGTHDSVILYTWILRLCIIGYVGALYVVIVQSESGRFHIHRVRRRLVYVITVQKQQHLVEIYYLLQLLKYNLLYV